MLISRYDNVCAVTRNSEEYKRSIVDPSRLHLFFIFYVKINLALIIQCKMECKIENATLIEQVIDLALFDH